MYEFEDYDTGLPKLDIRQMDLNTGLRGLETTRVSSLGNQVDTSRMAESFKKNAELLDEKTAKYTKGKDKGNLIGVFSGVEVYIVDRDGMGMVKGAMKDEGVSFLYGKQTT